MEQGKGCYCLCENRHLISVQDWVTATSEVKKEIKDCESMKPLQIFWTVRNGFNGYPVGGLDATLGKGVQLQIISLAFANPIFCLL